MRNPREVLAAVGVVIALAAAPALPAADAVVPGEVIVEPPTLQSIGLEWPLSGDANRNAAVTVRFRAKGATAWREGLPLLRLGGEETKYLSVDYTAPPMFAGSLFDLAPDTTYEVALRITDPDGGSSRPSMACWVRSTWAPRIPTGSTPTCRACSPAT